MDNHRNEIIQLIDRGAIDAASIDRAITANHIYPDTRSWMNFVEKLLLWLGALSLSISVLFFIAYNWDAMGRFAKFALVEMTLVITVFIYWKTTHSHPLLSKIALLSASILVGVLLAFYGQTYQTGADTWQLFATWTLMILPWTLLSRFSVQWLLWIGLLNLCAILYIDTYPELFRFLFRSESKVLWALFFINITALIFWESLQGKWSWLSGRWAVRLLALVSLFALTVIVIEMIFIRQRTAMSEHWLAYQLFSGVIWSITIGLIYMIYRRLKPDLFMLSMGVLSMISVITSLVAKGLFHSISEDVGAFFILTLVVIGLGTAAALWLKNVHRALLNENRGSI